MREQHGPLREQHGYGGQRRPRIEDQQQQAQHGNDSVLEQQGPQGYQNYRGQHGVQGQQEYISFGNYDLVKRIDVGGMGEVYLAHQRTAFGREVAVKIIRSDLVHDSVARKRFLREAEVNSHLKHEHILSLVEFGEEQGRLFLVTPYIAGGTLAQRLQRGPMSLSEVHELFTSLIRAVSYIHKHGVVHRDLKPSNILLDQDEDGQVHVRLIDFGIASIQGNTDNPGPALTQAGHEMATIEYMAPERLDGIAAPSNDIYSLGVILYEMLTGERPTQDRESDLAQLSAPMRYVVEHCTYTDPAKRFPNADRLLNVFEQAYRAMLAQEATPMSASVSVPGVSRRVDDGTGATRNVDENQDYDAKEDETPRRVARPVTYPAAPPAPLSSAIPTVASPESQRVPYMSRSDGFSNDDYSARTTYIDPSLLTGQQTTSNTTFTSSPKKARRNRSLFAILTLIIVIIMLLIGSLGYVIFVSSITATVNLSPQVHTVVAVLAVQAKPGQHNVDTKTSTVPAYILTSTKTGSQTGNTTGQTCTLIIINCQPSVSITDIATIADAERPTLQKQIQQDLTTQAQTNGETLVGQVSYSDTNVASNPGEGTVSKTVTVSLTEQGGVEAIKAKDVQSLAQTQLVQKAQQQYGPGYALITADTRIGNPVVQNVDANGVVNVKIAVGGVVEYNLSSSLMQGFQNAIRGKKQQAAASYLTEQPGIDTSSVVVHVSYGDTVPSNPQQIHIIPVAPSNIPTVQLPSV